MVTQGMCSQLPEPLKGRFGYRIQHDIYLHPHNESIPNQATNKEQVSCQSHIGAPFPGH